MSADSAPMLNESTATEAGHSLDLLIAERVFGVRLLTQDEMRVEAEKVWTEQPACRAFLAGFTAIDHAVIGGPFTFRQQIPRYSTDMRDAWTVAMYLREVRRYGMELTNMPNNGPECFVYTGNANERRIEVVGRTAPHAICLAALKAVESSHVE